METFKISPIVTEKHEDPVCPYTYSGKLNRCIVKITRDRYRDSSGAWVSKTRCYILKRKSGGWQVLEYEDDIMGTEDLLKELEIETLRPGYYQVTVDYHRDWETGIVDDRTIEFQPWCPKCESKKPFKEKPGPDWIANPEFCESCRKDPA